MDGIQLLGTTYVDLLLFHHRCATPEETCNVWTALEAALKDGRAKAIGVSNFDADDLAKLRACATEPIAVNEAHFAVGVMDYDTIACVRVCVFCMSSFWLRTTGQAPVSSLACMC